ncbi:hypothetical protein [Verrucomicrobium sp. BvORR034]|uniref:hypothetical protein n=1 Tax=Verrucomicrobium sp. BvORR034 TaxID=1396418 RepID=UPI0006786CA7|nr:hypothetical protein [Verrucomicrobium sp. BvORR034]
MNRSEQSLFVAAMVVSLVWVIVHTALNLVLDNSAAVLASLMMDLFAGMMVVSGVVRGGTVFRAVSGTQCWRGAMGAGIGAGLLYALVTGVVVLALGLNGMMVLFPDNFGIRTPADLAVVVTTLLTGLGAVHAVVFCSERNRWGYLVVGLAVALAGVCLRCWRLPGAKGLMH